MKYAEGLVEEHSKQVKNFLNQFSNRTEEDCIDLLHTFSIIVTIFIAVIMIAFNVAVGNAIHLWHAEILCAAMVVYLLYSTFKMRKNNDYTMTLGDYKFNRITQSVSWILNVAYYVYALYWLVIGVM